MNVGFLFPAREFGYSPDDGNTIGGFKWVANPGKKATCKFNHLVKVGNAQQLLNETISGMTITRLAKKPDLYRCNGKVKLHRLYQNFLP